MREALEALNRLVADGVVRQYAIGGAIGASFYIKAVQTEDVDVFVFMPQDGFGLLSLTPIYEALKAQGGFVEGEHIRFGQWPVQLLPDLNPLVAEAIREAIAVDYDGTPTRVFRAEHLCAIALQTGRSKDYLRVRMFLDHGALDVEELKRLLDRFELRDRLLKLTIAE